MYKNFDRLDINFNPRSPCGERPFVLVARMVACHFNPRSPCGERLGIRNVTRSSPSFQSTLPLRGATQSKAPESAKPSVFQSTLPLRGATLRLIGCLRRQGISIHAPLAGSDRRRNTQINHNTNFNPRSPCGERPGIAERRGFEPLFQSTLPLRGATRTAQSTRTQRRDFNPRSPCGERRNAEYRRCRSKYFNPRSPCGERPLFRVIKSLKSLFQSTLPLRGATA